MEGIRVNGTFDDVVEAAKKLDQQEEMHESKLKEGNIYRSVADYIWANYNKEIREFNPTTVEDCQKFVINHIDHSRIKNKETVKGICHGASYLLLDWLGNGEGNIIDVRGQYSESKTFSHERQIFQEENSFKEAYKYKNKAESMVKDFCVKILENDKDLFDLGRNTKIINYDDAKATDYSRGIVYIRYCINTAYVWNCGFKPKNKKLAKLFDDLYANDNDMYLYPLVDCEFSATENGIKLTVSMVISDAYGTFLVKDYKPTTAIINNGEDESEVYDKVYHCIYSTTSQF